MEKGEKFQSFGKLRIDPEQSRMGQKEKIRTSPSARTLIPSELGKTGYINENCWLAKTLNYSPAKRCQYCELKFPNCLFFQYLIISLILILFLLALSFLIEGKISKLVIISIFVFVIIYGYFFNKSTEKIIEANFAQRKTREEIEKRKEDLEKFYKLTVGRELRMVELKKQIKELEEKLKKEE